MQTSTRNDRRVQQQWIISSISRESSDVDRTSHRSIIFSTQRKKKKNRRLFIRRSKIDPQTTNNSSLASTPYPNLTVAFRSPTTKIKHRRIRRKLLNAGAGDDNRTSPWSAEQKQIDFTELEQIFDDAILNRLPVELYKHQAASRTQTRSTAIRKSSERTSVRVP